MSIDYEVDFGELAGVIGTVKGVAKVLNDQKYMDRALTHAWKRAKTAFDNDAAAYAVATGTIPHMFEWGTQGVNKGRTNRRMPPTSPEAKLWKHELSGYGRTKEASFVFQPSVVPVPPPTTAKTGVPRAELDKLTGGPYIFAAKAAIMEAGTAVTIRPREGDKLFVPFGQEGPRGESSRGRNFVFTKSPVHVIPGKTIAGNFSKFWLLWWSTEGSKIVTEQIQNRVDYEVENLVDSIGRSMAKRPMKPSSRSFMLTVEKAKALAERTLYEMEAEE